MKVLCTALIVFILTFGDFLHAAKRGSRTYRGRSYSAGSRTVRVRPHTTRRGTYIAPHRRTAPNRSRMDNWSTKGNVNPYTNKMGTADPVKPRIQPRHR